MFTHGYTIFTICNNLHIFFLLDNNFIARHFKRAKKFKNPLSRGLWNPLAVPALLTFPGTTRTYTITNTAELCIQYSYAIIFSWIVLTFRAQCIRLVPTCDSRFNADRKQEITCLSLRWAFRPSANCVT